MLARRGIGDFTRIRSPLRGLRTATVRAWHGIDEHGVELMWAAIADGEIERNAAAGRCDAQKASRKSI